MSNDAPIAIFDSGLGGLSVWKEVKRILPNESILYFGDTANCPYGHRSHEDILSLTLNAIRFLIDKNAKLVVVACNTATAAAIDVLRERFGIPFVGMEPAVKPAALNTQTGVIGVLATAGTFAGKLYRQTKSKYAEDKLLVVRVGTGLVEAVEENRITELKTQKLIEGYVKPMIDKNADRIVLGCTHYPFLKSVIAQIIPSNVEIVDPAIPVAKRTADLLEKHDLLNRDNQSPQYTFYATGNSETMKDFVNKIIPVCDQVLKPY